MNIQDGSLAGREFALHKDEQESLLIGRGAECGVRFAEPTVSTRHAKIAADGQRYYLLDQRSENGTYVNGARVEQMRLRDGDGIRLGAKGPLLRVSIDEYATGRMPAAVTGKLSHTTERVLARNTLRWEISETAYHHLGFFDPEHDSGKSLHTAPASVMFVITAALGLMVLALVVADLGWRRAVVYGGVSLVSVTVYLAIFLWLDRYDPEPFSTLAVAFAWGATFAVFIAVLANNLFDLLIGEHLTTVLSAPFIEEASKGLGVLIIAFFFRRDFDSIVDGIVYSGVIALGFAAVENIEYYGVSPEPSHFFRTFFLRGVLSPFSHVMFTCMTGIGLGIARETHHRRKAILAPLLGFLLAVFLHALWNWLAIKDLTTFFAGYLLLEMPIFFCFVCAIAFLVHREGVILKATLAREVERGLISQHQLDIAISVFRRSGWMLGALGNRKLLYVRRRFLRAVAKLGLCHWHEARASQASRDTGSFSLIAKLQGEVFSLRDRVD
ncbi:MAG: PrsW family glutamic-type intramembrane protease [Blastocatellia bacterium]